MTQTASMSQPSRGGGNLLKWALRLGALALIVIVVLSLLNSWETTVKSGDSTMTMHCQGGTITVSGILPGDRQYQFHTKADCTDRKQLLTGLAQLIVHVRDALENDDLVTALYTAAQQWIIDKTRQ